MSKETFIPKWEGPCDGCGEFEVLHEHQYDDEFELLCNNCITILEK